MPVEHASTMYLLVVAILALIVNVSPAHADSTRCIAAEYNGSWLYSRQGAARTAGALTDQAVVPYIGTAGAGMAAARYCGPALVACEAAVLAAGANRVVDTSVFSKADRDRACVIALDPSDVETIPVTTPNYTVYNGPECRDSGDVRMTDVLLHRINARPK